MMDWLLKTALDAIAIARPDMKNWIETKRKDRADDDRLRALQFVCFTLDAGNQKIVADALSINHADLVAAGRVLQKI